MWRTELEGAMGRTLLKVSLEGLDWRGCCGRDVTGEGLDWRVSGEGLDWKVSWEGRDSKVPRDTHQLDEGIYSLPQNPASE